MSVGEVVSLFERQEIDIQPEFQRFFRWTPEQKSNFIESILLGIPIPSIFVAQRKSGVWELIDGLQRISTILEVMGLLRDEHGDAKPQLQLKATKYLDSLEGKTWGGEDPDGGNLSLAQRLQIKRAKLDVKIVLEESGQTAKYELFQRLNTGGSSLAPQEVRNCILIMIDRSSFGWLNELSRNEDFGSCLSLSDRLIEEQYNMELAMRFVLFRQMSDDLDKIGNDLTTFLDKHAINMAKGPFDFDTEKRAFESTFRMLNEALGDESFKKFDQDKGRFVGSFSVSLFEVIALGLGYNFESWQAKEAAERIEELKAISRRNILSEGNLSSNTGSGVSPGRRIPKTVRHGREIFTV